MTPLKRAGKTTRSAAKRIHNRPRFQSLPHDASTSSRLQPGYWLSPASLAPGAMARWQMIVDRLLLRLTLLRRRRLLLRRAAGFDRLGFVAAHPHFDPARPGVLGFRQPNPQDAVLILRFGLVGVDLERRRDRPLEAAMPQLVDVPGRGLGFF